MQVSGVSFMSSAYESVAKQEERKQKEGTDSEATQAPTIPSLDSFFFFIRFIHFSSLLQTLRKGLQVNKKLIFTPVMFSSMDLGLQRESEKKFIKL